MAMFRNNLRLDTIPGSAYIARVLVPEVAILLIQQDMGLKYNEALQILKESREWGLAMHSDDL